MSNGTEPWEFGNTGGAGEPDPFLTYDPVQPQDLKEYRWESSVEEPTRSRLVKDKGPRIDTRPFAEPLKIKEEDNIPCDCGTCAEEKQQRRCGEEPAAECNQRDAGSFRRRRRLQLPRKVCLAEHARVAGSIWRRRRCQP